MASPATAVMATLFTPSAGTEVTEVSPAGKEDIPARVFASGGALQPRAVKSAPKSAPKSAGKSQEGWQEGKQAVSPQTLMAKGVASHIQ